jgi:Zn-dependent protease
MLPPPSWRAPLVLWIAIFSYTRFDALNAVLAMLGGFSPVVAIFNLLPVGHLDGSIGLGHYPRIDRAETVAAKQRCVGVESVPIVEVR